MSPREKNLWIKAVGLVLLIYSTLYIVRGPVEMLRQRGLLRPVVAAVFVVAALWLARLVWRRRPGPRELLALAIFGLVFLWFVWITKRPEERLHLLEYGLLAGLIYAALVERVGGGDGRCRLPIWVPFAAIAITGLCGWLDEGIQYLLPNRVYDLRDAALNVAAAVVAVGAMYVGGVAGRGDRGGSSDAVG